MRFELVLATYQSLYFLRIYLAKGPLKYSQARDALKDSKYQNRAKSYLGFPRE